MKYISELVALGTNEESIYLLSPIRVDKVLPCESLTLLHFQVVHSWESSNSCRLPSWLPTLCLQRSPRAESERYRGCNSGKVQSLWKTTQNKYSIAEIGNKGKRLWRWCKSSQEAQYSPVVIEVDIKKVNSHSVSKYSVNISFSFSRVDQGELSISVSNCIYTYHLYISPASGLYKYKLIRYYKYYFKKINGIIMDICNIH